jgi:hypothetical protein
MAGAGIAIREGSGSLPNPATVPLGGFYFGVVREYGIPELTSGVTEWSKGRTRMDMASLSFGAYSEVILEISHGMTPGSTQVGVRLMTAFAWPAGHAARQDVGVMGGMVRGLSDGSSVGAVLSKEELAVGYALQSGHGTLAIDMARSAEGDVAVRVGWSTSLGKALRVRGGIVSTPATAALGIGLGAGKVRFDVGISRHEVLGITQAWGISWLF